MRRCRQGGVCQRTALSTRPAPSAPSLQPPPALCCRYAPNCRHDSPLLPVPPPKHTTTESEHAPQIAAHLQYENVALLLVDGLQAQVVAAAQWRKGRAAVEKRQGSEQMHGGGAPPLASASAAVSAHAG